MKRQAIRDAYGFDLPEDFYAVWEFARTLKAKDPASAFADLGVSLAGAYDVLSSEVGPAGPLPAFLHARFHSDPPEFITVAFGDCDGSHFGYWFDERPTRFEVAHYFLDDAYEITPVGATLFDAFRRELELRWQSAHDGDERAELRRLDKFRTRLVAASGDTRPQLGDKFVRATKASVNGRLSRVTELTREGMGIVAKATELASTELASTELRAAELASTELRAAELREPGCVALWQLCDNPSFETIRALVDVARKRAAQGDYVPALRLGRELWSATDPKVEVAAAELLELAYVGLERPELASAEVRATELATNLRAHARYRWLPDVNITAYDEASLLQAEKEAAERSPVKMERRAYVVDRSDGVARVSEVDVPDDLKERLQARFVAQIGDVPDSVQALAFAQRELAVSETQPKLLELACDKACGAGNFASLAELAKALCEQTFANWIFKGHAYAVIAADKLGQAVKVEEHLTAIIGIYLAEEPPPSYGADEDEVVDMDSYWDEAEMILRELAPRRSAEVSSRLLEHETEGDLRNNHFHRKAMALHQAGDDGAARTCLREWLEEDESPIAWHWLAHLTTGKESMDAYAKAREFFEDWDDEDYAYQLACICAMLGDARASLKYLKLAAENDAEDLENASTDRELDSVRHLPAFVKLLARYS